MSKKMKNIKNFKIKAFCSISTLLALYSCGTKNVSTESKNPDDSKTLNTVFHQPSNDKPQLNEFVQILNQKTRVGKPVEGPWKEAYVVSWEYDTDNQTSEIKKTGEIEINLGVNYIFAGRAFGIQQKPTQKNNSKLFVQFDRTKPITFGNLPKNSDVYLRVSDKVSKIGFISTSDYWGAVSELRICEGNFENLCRLNLKISRDPEFVKSANPLETPTGEFLQAKVELLQTENENPLQIFETAAIPSR
jgi:hypothetical protein